MSVRSIARVRRRVGAFWCRLTGGLLARVRFLFGVLALLNVAMVAPGVVVGGGGRFGVFGLVGLVGLAVVWVRAWRRGEFCTPSRVVEPGLLLLAAWASPSAAMLTGVYYVGLNYGALYGSRSVALVRGLAIFVVFAAAHGLQDGLGAVGDPTMFAHAAGAVLTSLVMSLLAESVVRQQASEQAKDEFLAVVSHELRTPLTSMLGLLLTLDRHGDRLEQDERQHLVTRALVNAQRQRQLVEDLLNVSRVLDGALDAQVDDIVVAPVVEQAVASSELDAGPVVTVPHAHRARVDPGHLRQILVNLLTNAEKYGAAPIEVTSTLADDGRSVVLRVRDHGPGVAPEFVAQLFGRFTQESTGDRRTARGMGLGLWISQSLAGANGGDLTYESARGPGACFALSLPVAATDAESISLHRLPDDISAPEAPSFTATQQSSTS